MSEISEGNPKLFASAGSRAGFGFAVLLCLHTVICSVSLIYLAEEISFYQPSPLSSSIHLFGAVLNVTLFTLVAIVFLISRFSFGYILGFYFYTMILGYLWLIEFSPFHYDHSRAIISISLSALAFLLPALFITSPIKQRFVLSAGALDLALSLVLALGAATVAIGAFYNFRLVGVSDIYNFRQKIEFPGFLNYAMGISSNTLLPFAFACFVARGNCWRAGAVLLLLVLLYPVTLTKLTLFAPFWLLFLLLLSKIVKIKVSVVLSLLLPLVFGLILVVVYRSGLIPSKSMYQLFGLVNVRMVGIPSVALDVYNDFFSTHSLTHFCQISFLKPFVHCPYTQPISSLMEPIYLLGNFNASLFATEGIASVGPLFAPLSALVCGLVIAAVNRLSSGLPPTFILLSGGILPQAFLNVPFSTTLLTHGASILFLLWYVMPRSIFEQPRSPALTDSDLRKMA